MDYSIEKFFSIAGLNICVTGASGQLGQEIVSSLLTNGAKVTAVDLDINVLKTVAKQKKWNQNSIYLASGDICKKSTILQVLKESTAKFGDLNALVNNAGVSVFEEYLDRPDSSIDWVMDVNLKGTLLCIKEFIKHIKKQNSHGTVVNIASHYGLISPDPRIYVDCERKNSEIYGATKAGIIQMTRYYAVHAAPYNVRVNAVSPGGIRNPNNPQGPEFQKQYNFRCPIGRMAETHEIVGAILFLLSPATSYITGHNLIVDGGMTCW